MERRDEPLSAPFQSVDHQRHDAKKPHYYAPDGHQLATLNGEVSQEQLEYYELRAKGGTGLITIENICIDFPFASNGTTQLRIDNDQYIPRLFKLTETLHKHGACVSIQLRKVRTSS